MRVLIHDHEQRTAAEPASSPSSSSGDDSSVSSTSSEESSSAVAKIRNLEDLPSDDSVSLDSSSSSDDDEASESSRGSSSQQDEEYDNEDDVEQHMTLQERLEKRRTEGSMKLTKALHDKRRRKKEAIEKGREQLHKSDKNLAEKETKTKKRSKHAPTVASSLRRDFYQRGAPLLNSSGNGVEIGSGRYKARDPRFSSDGNTKSTNHNYEFMKEKHLEEIKRVKQRIALRKLTGRRGQRRRQAHRAELQQTTLEQDEAILQRLIQQRATLQQTELQQQVQKVVQENYHQQGYYPKRNKVKQITTELKYEQLKRKGGQNAINKALTKRRKKNKSKDAKLF